MSLRAISLIAVSSEQQATDERASLADQEARNLHIVRELGATLIDTIRVPGFSRNWYTFHEFALAAAADGITDPMRLIEHWQRRDFDVLIVREGSRFGRKESIFAEVVLRTTDIGAFIQLHSGERIDHTNRSMYIALGAYQAAGEITQIQRRKAIGMTKRFKDGLPTNTKVPLSHRIVRTERGTIDHIELNPDSAQLWQDVAALLLRGIGWANLPAALAAEFGHRRADGRLLFAPNLYRTIFNPMFWGHLARFHRGKLKREMGLWVFDPSEPVPPPIEITRDVFPAVYTGELAERVKSELRRRAVIGKGISNSYHTRVLSGLVVCAYCLYRMSHQTTRGKQSYACKTAEYHRKGRRTHDCACTVHSIPLPKLQAAISDMLGLLLDSHDPAFLQRQANDGQTAAADQLRKLEADHEATKKLAGRLLLQKAGLAEELQSVLDDKIEETAQRLRALNTKIAQQKAIISTATANIAQATHAYQCLQQSGAVGFWQLPDTEINQHLHALLGKHVFVVADGELKGIIPLTTRVYSP